MKPSSVCGRRFFSTTASAQSGLHAGRPPADDANSGGSPVREVGLAPASPLSSRSEGRFGDAVEEVKRGEDLPLGARSPPKGERRRGGVDGPGAFSFSIPYTVTVQQLGHLEVFEEDVSDGEGFPPGRTVIPLVLKP